MSHPTPLSTQDEFIERIVREVIRRLLAMEGKPYAPAEPTKTNHFTEVALPAMVTIGDRVITAALIDAVPKGVATVQIRKKAILTPLAKDQAKDRGIQIQRSDGDSKK